MKKLMISLLLLVSIVIIVTQYAYALYDVVHEAEASVVPNVFDAYFTVYLDGAEVTSTTTLPGGGTVIEAQSGMVNLDGTLLLNNPADITSEKDLSYYPSDSVKRLSCTVTINTHTPIRFRVKVLAEWRVRRDYLDGTFFEDVLYYEHDPEEDDHQITSPFYISPKFLYLRDASASGGYFYFKGYSPTENGVDIFNSKGIIPKTRNSGNAEGQFVVPFIVGATTYQTFPTDNYQETVRVHLSLIVEVIQANRYHALWHVPVNFYD
jgi:hypothetical protein